MSEKVLFKIQLYFTGVISVAIWSLLTWNYYHGGVPSHHLLAREDWPSFSNWWGGLLLPLLTWFLLYRIQKRIFVNKNKNSELLNFPINIVYGFIGALLFGILLSLLFTIGNTEMPSYMMMWLLVSALFIPIYRAECFLGFVIGMTFTFGGVLPILIGSILTLLGAILFLFVKPSIVFVFTKFSNLVTDKSKNIFYKKSGEI